MDTFATVPETLFLPILRTPLQNTIWKLFRKIEIWGNKNHMAHLMHIGGLERVKMMNINLGDEDGLLETSTESLKDLKTGEWIEVHSPEMFDLETILLDSAYYTFQGREY